MIWEKTSMLRVDDTRTTQKKAWVIDLTASMLDVNLDPIWRKNGMGPKAKENWRVNITLTM